MSKLYSRARTPPSSPSISQKSTTTSRHSNSKGYSLPNKAYSDREYEKYEKYSNLDKYEKPKYDKSSNKRDRYDKFEKSDSYATNKDYSRETFPMTKTTSKPLEKYTTKREDSYRDIPLSFNKPKSNLYLDQGYPDRDNYLPKYAPREADRYSKYSTTKDLPNPKFPPRPPSASCLSERGENKKYVPYSTEKSMPYSKYSSGVNSYFPSESTYSSFNSYEGSKGQSGRGKMSGETRNFSGTSMRNVGGKSFSSSDMPPDMYNSMQSSYGRNAVAGTSQSTKSFDRYAPKKRSPERKYLDRYVIGDSVVYGSPGHYPKDIYPPSPKAKRHRSPDSPPPSPPPMQSKHANMTSMGKSYSRYSSNSPKRYRSSSNKSPPPRGDLAYSTVRVKSPITNSHRDSLHSASYRKPPSPPPIAGFRTLSPQGYSRSQGLSRNYTPPPERNKGDRFEFNKDGRNFHTQGGGNLMNRDNHFHLKIRDRNDQSKPMESYRDKDQNYSKNIPLSSYQNQPMRGSLNNFNSRDKYLHDRPPPPRPIGSPKPLLSIPLSVNSIPRESRANVRETLSIGFPRNRLIRGGDRDDGMGMRRFDGRIGMNQNSLNQGRGQISAKRRLPLSPKDRRKKRPDDLRLWIESRKSEGIKRNVSPSGRGRMLPQKRPARLIGEGVTGGVPQHRSRLLDSRRRILNKGKRKGGGGVVPLKRGLKKPRRMLPQKAKPRNDDRVVDRKSIKRDHNSSGDIRRNDGDKRNDRRGDRDKKLNIKENGSKNKGSTRGQSGSLTNTHRLIRRPKVVSTTNCVPLKPRSIKRSTQRSSHDRERSSNKNGKSHQSSKSETKGRSPSRKERENSSGRN